MKSPTTGPWESRPIGSKGDIGIYVLNAPPSCGVIARIPFTDTKPVVENTGRRPAFITAAAIRLALATLSAPTPRFSDRHECHSRPT